MSHQKIRGLLLHAHQHWLQIIATESFQIQTLIMSRFISLTLNRPCNAIWTQIFSKFFQIHVHLIYVLQLLYIRTELYVRDIFLSLL